MTKKQLKQAFEEWAKGRAEPLSLHLVDGRYVVSNTRDAFEAFKAGYGLARIDLPTTPPVPSVA